MVIEDPINVISNVGRSSYHFVRAQRLFQAAHDALAHALGAQTMEGLGINANCHKPSTRNGRNVPVRLLSEKTAKDRLGQ